LGPRRLRRVREEEAEAQEFQAVHRRMSDRVEGLLLRLVIFGLVALALVQMLAVIPPVRRTLNLREGTDGYALTQDSEWWQRLTGGDKAAAVSLAPTRPSVTVVLISRDSAPEARLLVDGKAVSTFAKPSVTVSVAPGQTLTVDGSRYGQELQFRVVAAPGLASPKPGLQVSTHGDRMSLGTVKTAH
jgi:hypothetical protein